MPFLAQYDSRNGPRAKVYAVKYEPPVAIAVPPAILRASVRRLDGEEDGPALSDTAGPSFLFSGEK